MDAVGGQEGGGVGAYTSPPTAPQQQHPVAVAGGAGSLLSSSTLQFNAEDGTVVLSSKPVPLVKPVSLLRKTVGFPDSDGSA